MTLSAEERSSIVNYRIHKAYECLTEAKDNGKMNHWSLAASRLYYTAFHISSALLVSRGIQAHTHSGLIHIVGFDFVKNGLLPKEDGRLFSQLYNMRQKGDYDDFFDWAEEDVAPYFEKTEQLLKRIEALIKTSAVH